MKLFPKHEITGIVLAGGRAQRMGGVDKGLVLLNGKPMVEHVLTTLRPQVGTIYINANRNLDQYAAFGYKVISDLSTGYLGPLAGMASGMQAANTQYILTVPCDSPLIGPDLVQRLYAVLIQEDADIGVAHDGERMHPVFTLLRRDLLASLLACLNSGERKIDRWFAQHKLAIVYFTDMLDTFLNINNQQELESLELKLNEASQC